MALVDWIITPLGWALRSKRTDPGGSVQFAPQLNASGSFGALTITSPSFEADKEIPRKHSGTGRGPNVSPGLDWGRLPEGTEQILLIIEDTDVPMAQPIIHTIALLEPASPTGVPGIPEGAMTPGNLRVHYVPAFHGWVGYSGPRPLPGHGVHHYGFHVYALDTVIEAHDADGIRDLLELVHGHVLASGVLTGTQRS
ncbi:YbhB/YbcL family Raf kinase inhibitor-like protein [Rathayibacter sp. CAU 1779]